MARARCADLIERNRAGLLCGRDRRLLAGGNDAATRGFLPGRMLTDIEAGERVAISPDQLATLLGGDPESLSVIAEDGCAAREAIAEIINSGVEPRATIITTLEAMRQWRELLERPASLMTPVIACQNPMMASLVIIDDLSFVVGTAKTAQAVTGAANGARRRITISRPASGYDATLDLVTTPYNVSLGPA